MEYSITYAFLRIFECSNDSECRQVSNEFAFFDMFEWTPIWELLYSWTILLNNLNSSNIKQPATAVDLRRHVQLSIRDCDLGLVESRRHCHLVLLTVWYIVLWAEKPSGSANISSKQFVFSSDVRPPLKSRRIGVSTRRVVVVPSGCGRVGWAISPQLFVLPACACLRCWLLSLFVSDTPANCCRSHCGISDYDASEIPSIHVYYIC